MSDGKILHIYEQPQGTPFFFKQWGGKKKKQTCNLLDGREHHEFPDTREGSDE